VEPDPKTEVFFIEHFVPPLTVDKVFVALSKAKDGGERQYYENLLEYILNKVGTDVDAFASLKGFNIRDGIPLIHHRPEDIAPLPVLSMSPREEIDYLRREVESTREMYAKLSEIRMQEKEDSKSSFWAMVALVALIVAGYFGFGDY
jgi:hypothetical protein